ncbi:MAG: hypothetical protein ABIN97_15925 [Ginsengibacter sp.]
MKHSTHIYNELREIAPFLADLDKTNVFTVPDNYFQLFDIQILKKINNDSFDVLPAFEQPLLSVPEGYFENLAGSILQKIKNLDIEDPREELKEPCPVLYQAPNQNVFTVPDGYFENLPVALLNVVKPKAKVVVMKKRNMVWNSAAAAVLTGIMAMSALWISNNSVQKNTVTAYNKTIPLNVKDALQYKNEQQINEGIANLSDADIIKYLEITGSNADEEILASGIREKELPAEQDYLIDENTLQNFLGKIELQNN